MQGWIIGIMDQFKGFVAYWVIMLLIAIENVFPPIPSEIILTFGGFLTTDPKREMNPWMVTIFSTLGSVVGALILYGLGRLLSKERLVWIIDKWGRVLRLKRKDLDNAESWFNRKGSATVFFCRFIPIIRSLISIPAGMAKMKLGKFLLLTTTGTFIWNIVLINLGAIMGNNWEKIAAFFSTYSDVTLVVLVAAVLFGIFWFIRSRRNGRLNKAANGQGSDTAAVEEKTENNENHEEKIINNK